MLELAREKFHQQTDHSVIFDTFDISDPSRIPNTSIGVFDGLISTLVLEHIPIATYFSVISKLLRAGCYAVVTSMHSDMGRLTRAGYKTAEGERFKATSYIYTPAETVEAARAAGLELFGELGEVAVDVRMIDGGVLDNGVRVERGAVAERARKWVGTKVWYGMILKKVDVDAY